MGDENKRLRTIDTLNSSRKNELENCRRLRKEGVKNVELVYKNLTANLSEVQKEIAAKWKESEELTEQYCQQLKRIRELKVLKLIRMDFGIK